MTTVIGNGNLFYFKQGTWRSLRSWTPADVTTELWLDADDASTVSLNGSNVSSWADKSGNGNDATQATAASQPAYTANGLNGKSVVTFANDHLIMSNSISRAPTTIGIVYKFNSFTDANPRVYDIKRLSQSIQLIRDGASTLVGTKDTVWQTGSNGSLWHTGQTTTPEIIVADFSDTTTALYLDGTSGSATTTTNIGAGGTTNSTLGVRGDLAGTTRLYGYIAELVICAGILSTENRQALEGYFAHKWGLTGSLPAGHPYKTIAP